MQGEPRRRHSGSIKIETKIMAIRQDAEILMVPAAILLQLLPLVVSLTLIQKVTRAGKKESMSV